MMASKNGSNVKTAEMEVKVSGKGKLLTWDQMLEAPKDPDWIIENLVTSSSVVTVFGNGGSKKTYSVIDLVMCYMVRQEWLIFKIPKPSPVLFIDEESGRDRLSLRYMEAKNGYNVKSSLPIYTVCMARYSLRSPEDVMEIKSFIKATGARMVVIDSLVTVLCGDENSSKEVAQLYANLKSIAEELKCVIFIIHHANKLEGYRGSTAIRDQSDLLIHVTSKSESPNIDFETDKERDIAHTKWSAVSYLDKGKKFYLISSSSKLRKLGKAQEIVITYLNEYECATMEDLKVNHGECSSAAIRNAAYKLLDDKFVSNDEWKGKSRLFRLTEIGKNYANQYLPVQIDLSQYA